MKHNLLVVTDHSTHSATNSLYELALAMRHDARHPNVWVCSKGLPENEGFFAGRHSSSVFASVVKEDFSFHPDGTYIKKSAHELPLSEISAILIRMPQPLNPEFLLSLQSIVPARNIINDPAGTIETSSKEFLLQIAHLCPTTQMCYNLQEAIALSHEYELVLKPLYSYGGLGIVRLSPRYFWIGDIRFDAEEIFRLLPQDHFPMLAMRYLANVSFGDKRTIVVNRQIVGSALRMPPPDSWICNVAQGGHAILSQVDEVEKLIEKELTPLLFEKGIVIYGFDTLMDDDGIRVLSEINTLSIGGLGPIEEMSGKPIVQHTASLLWDYINSR